MGLPRAVELDRGGAGEVHLGLERHRVRTSLGGAARVLVVARRPQRRIQAFENAMCVRAFGVRAVVAVSFRIRFFGSYTRTKIR